MSDIPHAEQFRFTKTPSGKKAFEAYSAIWFSCGDEIAISAPTLNILKEQYRRISGDELIAEAAQHVWIVAFEEIK